MNSRQIQIAAVAVAALVLSGGGFVAGMTVGPTLGKSEAPAAANASPGVAGAQGRRQVAGGPGAGAFAGGQGQQVSGRVISVNDGSITVETREPGGDTTRSVIALVGSTARVVRSTEVDIKLSDIKAGDQVLIVGSPDATTGTVTANAVVVGVNALQQLFGGGPGGAGGQPRPSGSPGTRPLPSASARP
jgi:hypothetical protein